jgi:hypothetical protein
VKARHFSRSCSKAIATHLPRLELSGLANLVSGFAKSVQDTGHGMEVRKSRADLRDFLGGSAAAGFAFAFAFAFAALFLRFGGIVGVSTCLERFVSSSNAHQVGVSKCATLKRMPVTYSFPIVKWITRGALRKQRCVWRSCKQVLSADVYKMCQE